MFKLKITPKKWFKKPDSNIGEEAKGNIKAKFSFIPETNIKEDTQIIFTNSSENAQGFVWDFGDGNVSTDPNPKHTYRKEGEYKVKLIALNDMGTDSSKQNITIEV